MIPDFLALLLSATTRTGDAYPSVRAQGGGLPVMVCHLISDPRSYTLKGDSGLRRTRVQVDCTAATFAEASGLAEDITGALSGWRGTQGATRFLGIFVDGVQSGHDAAPEAGERSSTHTLSIDFIIRHRSAS